MINLQGTFTALITPFTADGSSVDLERLDRNVRHQALAGVQGVVPCGTTGETPTLSSEEYHEIVARVIDVGHSSGMKVIPGAGSNSTAHAIEYHRFAHRHGADAALHVNPYYNRPSQEGLYRHFMAIADSCELPIILYNIPGRTGVLMSLDTISRLARHPNIVAIKDATGGLDFVSSVVEQTSLTVLSGDDPLTLPMAILGARGVISVLSNLLPDRVAALSNAFLSGDWEGARRLNDALLPLAKSLLGLDTNPVPIKTALALLGRDTGAVRLPLCEMSGANLDRLRQLLRQEKLESPVAASR